MRSKAYLVILACAALLGLPAFAGTTLADDPGDPVSCSGVKRVKLSAPLTDAVPAQSQGYADNPHAGVWGIFLLEIPIVTSIGTQAADATPETDDASAPVWYHMIGEATKAQECEEFVDEAVDAAITNAVTAMGAQKRYIEEQQVVTLMTALAEHLIDQAQPKHAQAG